MRDFAMLVRVFLFATTMVYLSACDNSQIKRPGTPGGSTSGSQTESINLNIKIPEANDILTHSQANYTARYRIIGQDSCTDYLIEETKLIASRKSPMIHISGVKKCALNIYVELGITQDTSPENIELVEVYYTNNQGVDITTAQITAQNLNIAPIFTVTPIGVDKKLSSQIIFTHPSQQPQVPAPQQPTTQVPAPQQPTTQVPAPQQPTTQVPVPQQPTTQVPVPQQPTTQVPAPQQPTTQVPVPQQPTTQVPVPQQPTTQVPAPQQPTTQVPGSNPEQPSTTPTPTPPKPNSPEPEPTTDGLEDFTYPVEGNVKWSTYVGHKGTGAIDIPINGKPVIAMMDGIVTRAVYQCRSRTSTHNACNGSGLGNYVSIRHTNGVVASYGHLHTLSVAKGEQVSRGQEVGISGNNGNSSGPHLHVHADKVRIDKLWPEKCNRYYNQGCDWFRNEPYIMTRRYQ